MTVSSDIQRLRQVVLRVVADQNSNCVGDVGVLFLMGQLVGERADSRLVVTFEQRGMLRSYMGLVEQIFPGVQVEVKRTKKRVVLMFTDPRVLVFYRALAKKSGVGAGFVARSWVKQNVGPVVRWLLMTNADSHKHSSTNDFVLKFTGTPAIRKMSVVLLEQLGIESTVRSPGVVSLTNGSDSLRVLQEGGVPPRGVEWALEAERARSEVGLEKLAQANKKRSVDGGRRQAELVKDALRILESAGQLRDDERLVGGLRVHYPELSLRELGAKAGVSKHSAAGVIRRLVERAQEVGSGDAP